MISAGAVAAPGTIPATGASSDRQQEADGHGYHGSSDRCGRPRWMPVEDSTNVVTVEVPRQAPTQVAMSVGDQRAVAAGQVAVLVKHSGISGCTKKCSNCIEAVHNEKAYYCRDQRQDTNRKHTAEVKLESSDAECSRCGSW